MKSTKSAVKKSSDLSRYVTRRQKRPGVITPKLAAELKVLKEMTDEEIDLSDIPLKLDWSKAEIGKFYRPVKELVSLRVDADVLAWFKNQANGKLYTALMNKALRSYVLAHQK